VSDDAELRVGACELLLSWLHPFTWVQAYVPTMPDGPWLELLKVRGVCLGEGGERAIPLTLGERRCGWEWGGRLHPSALVQASVLTMPDGPWLELLEVRSVCAGRVREGSLRWGRGEKVWVGVGSEAAPFRLGAGLCLRDSGWAVARVA
jgi:hypothetical protein